MATYAIGDIQGCFRTLQALLERIRFDPACDRLWLVGDLVNRGPLSLEVLRWAKALGPAATIVLGNHELRLLSLAAGVIEPNARDTLEPVLAAPDRDELLAWIRSLPLVHAESDYLLVHAGVPAAWDLERVHEQARGVEAALQRDEGRALLELIRERGPLEWNPTATPAEKLRFTVTALTTMRACTAEGRIEHRFKGGAEDLPVGVFPWFEAPRRVLTGTTVVCGHWASLGLRQQPGLIALDSGCVWGGSLTAVRLEDRVAFQEPLCDSPTPEPPALRSPRVRP